MTVQEKLSKTGAKKLLALDGGGIRSIISLEVLAELERTLQKEVGSGDSFVLADYFDYIAGTGSGAFIATCLSLGMRVEKIQSEFAYIGTEAYAPIDSIYPRRSIQSEEKLNSLLQTLIGTENLGSDKLKTLLLLVLKNAKSDSPWIITNNPNAFYNKPNRLDCNLNIPLWQLVKASLTNPSYAIPENIQVNEHTFSLVDGSVSIYNNSSFLLFLYATAPIYNVNWPVGEQNLLITSIGTGRNPGANVNISPNEVNPVYNMGAITSGLLQSASFEQDFLCRFFGNCLTGNILSQEVGGMIEEKGFMSTKLFSYLRYDIELSAPSFLEMTLSSIMAEDIQSIEAINCLPELQLIGKATAKKYIKPEHFNLFSKLNKEKSIVSSSNYNFINSIDENKSEDILIAPTGVKGFDLEEKSFFSESEKKKMPSIKEDFKEKFKGVKEDFKEKLSDVKEDFKEKLSDVKEDFKEKVLGTTNKDNSNSKEDTVWIEQGYTYQGSDWWKWWVWIEGLPEELDQIEHVVYYLHPTFRDPVRTVNDRPSKFKLEASGWGVFRIKVLVVYKNADKKKLKHDLQLGYPDGSFTTE